MGYSSMGFTSMGTYFYKVKKRLIIDWADLCTKRELQVCSKAKFRIKKIVV
jgi:hypothetical protein